MPRWALIEGATPSPLKVRITKCWPALICALEYEKNTIYVLIFLLNFLFQDYRETYPFSLRP